MNKQALVIAMLISCFLAGCTDADLDDAEQNLGCTYSDAANYNSTAVVKLGRGLGIFATVFVLFVFKI